MKNYETVSDALINLSKRGYSTDFLIDAQKEGLIRHPPIHALSPDEFEIDELYRFNKRNDPGDTMLVFAISSKKHTIKGVIINGCGLYSDVNSSKIVERLYQKN